MFLHYIMREKYYIRPWHASFESILKNVTICEWRWSDQKYLNAWSVDLSQHLLPILDTRHFIILLVGKWTTLITALPIVKSEVVRFCCLFISLFWTELLAICVLWTIPMLTWFIISCISVCNKHLIPSTASRSPWDLEWN